MEKREFKDRVYQGITQLTKALANSHRVEIVELLAQGEKTVEHIAAETGVSVANASQHLQVLKGVQLLATRRQGNHIFYRLANDTVFAAWQSLRTLGLLQLAEVAQLVHDFRDERHTLERLSIEELVERQLNEPVVLLDVRPAEEYRLGHIPQALSMPLTELAEHARALPTGQLVVAYCRGPFCVFADEAVTYLRGLGYPAVCLSEGYPDWKQRGLPVAILN
ncbi:metalloregulator ArsR/SmtB family transcription factor [Hymenobacter koreensis]|uniref:Metalloregulator ArsR/SmtB family transcription factor n=1 Tax=Hymenobacter koreensis TaxID=1084523 RepID=A0ABP8JD52_9BACT